MKRLGSFFTIPVFVSFWVGFALGMSFIIHDLKTVFGG